MDRGGGGGHMGLFSPREIQEVAKKVKIPRFPSEREREESVDAPPAGPQQSDSHTHARMS